MKIMRRLLQRKKIEDWKDRFRLNTLNMSNYARIIDKRKTATTHGG